MQTCSWCGGNHDPMAEDALSYDAADDEMIRCMKSLKMTNKKKQRPKLKKTKAKWIESMRS